MMRIQYNLRMFKRLTAIVLGLAVSSALMAAKPYIKPDGAHIYITDDVVSRVGDTFALDYGEGIISVEMDDWDFHNEAAWINPGETVTV